MYEWSKSAIEKIILKLLNFLFGFSECRQCEKKDNCDMKPWLHEEKDCNYRKNHT